MADENNPYLETVRKEQAQRLQASVAQSANTNPDTEAKILQFSRQYDLPPETVRAIQPEVEARAKTDAMDFSSIVSQTPALANFLTDKAPIAHDDFHPLQAIEQGLKNTWGTVKAGTLDFVAGQVGAARGFLEHPMQAEPNAPGMNLDEPEPLSPTAGAQALANRLGKTQTAIHNAADAAAPVGRTWLEQQVNSGFRSLVSNAFGMAASVITRNPAPSLGLMTTQTYGQAYGEARDAGKTPEQAQRYGVVQGGLELATELAPAGKFISNLKVGSPVLKVLRDEVVREVPGEMVATLTQGFDQWAEGLDNKNKTFGDWLKSLPEQEAATIVSTLVSAGGMVAGGEALNHAVERVTGQHVERVAQAKQAEGVVEDLDSLQKLSAASKVRERDTSSFEAFVKAAAQDGPVTDVYVDAAQLNQLAAKPELVDVLPPAIKDQLEEAVASGGDVRIPVEQWASFAGSEQGAPLAQALMDHIKTDPTGFTKAQADEFMQTEGDRLQAQVEKVMTEKAADSAWTQSADKVREHFTEQLNSIKRFTPDVNEAYATVPTAFYTVMAAKMGITPEDMLARYPLRIAAEGLTTGTLDQKLTAPPVESDGTVRLVHWGNDPNMTETNPAAWGTNPSAHLPRSERERKAYAPGRTYFGIAPGQPGGYVREGTLGPHAFETHVPAERLYDMAADPDNLREAGRQAVQSGQWKQGETRSLYEQLIKNAGYAGYWMQDPSLGLVAASFEPLPVRQLSEATTHAFAQTPMGQKIKALTELTPGLKKVLPYLTDDEKAKLRKDSAQKLLKLIADMPSAEEMASVAWSGRAKRGWYENSAHALLNIFGLQDATRFAALLAATSPQSSVESNAYNALATWTNWINAGRPTDHREIIEIMGKSVQGKGTPESVLSAWVNNSLQALTAENPAEIVLSGPKVNSFMQNLLGVVDEVTNDAWMANYALMDQSVFKKTGPSPGKGVGYMSMSALVRRAAAILSKRTGSPWTPAEVQETVWSWARTLYNLTDKQGENRNAQQILAAGGLTAEDIASTPDFAMLFINGVYRRILEAGGYGPQLEAVELVERGRGSVNRDASGSDPLSAEGAGISEATLRRHLDAAAARLEELRSRRRDDPDARELRQDDNLAPLNGLPRLVKVDGAVVEFGPFAPAREAADAYRAETGIGEAPPEDYVTVDADRARRIAQAYEDMPNNPGDPEVAAAYDAMIEETLAQWQAIKATGLKVEFNPPGQDPYGNPRNAILDVVENNHLWVFPTDEGFGSSDLDVSSSPMLRPVPGETISGRPVVVNDIFRVVHDYFGHIKEGVGFRADGEENAWRSHSAMYSPLARKAMTTETRGQNSWVNYGPHGEANRTASGGETVYAPQKIGLLPDWVVNEGSGLENLHQSFKEEGISDLIKAADTALGGRAKKAIDGFIGMEHDAVEMGVEFGYMNARPLEAAYAPNASGAALETRNEIETAFALVRQQLREKYGPTIRLYRGQTPVTATNAGNMSAHEDGSRNVLSWTTDPRVSDTFAGVDPRFDKTLYTEDQIAAWEKEFEDNGKVKIGNRWLITETFHGWNYNTNEPLSAEGIGIFYNEDKAGGEVTDTDSVRDYVESINEDRQAYINRNAEARSRILTADVPIEELVWGSDRANQAEFIVRNRPEGIFVGPDGVLNRPADLNQSTQAKGLYNPGSNTITVLKRADLSTVLHEMGHHFLNVMADVADQPGAPQAVVDDMKIVLDWFGVPDLATWHAMSLDQQRESHEKFARGFEAYLFEGKAPSVELRGVFQRFRAWMLNVYRQISNLHVNVTPEVKGVFDRMLASVDEIRAAEQDLGYSPLVTAENAGALGVTPQELDNLQALGAQATQDAVAALEARSLRDMKWLSGARARKIRELQREAAGKRNTVRAEVTAEVMAEPVNKAREFLKHGRIDGEDVGGAHKLAIEEVEELYGKKDYEKLGYGAYGMLARSANGDAAIHPEQVAELFGYGSGDEMIMDLLTAEDAKAKIAALTDQRMLERYGDLTDAEAIAAAADAAIHNDARLKFVAAEAAALARASGGRKVLGTAARSFAAGMVGRLRIRDLKPARYSAAERRAGDVATKEFARGNLVEAATAKRNQLINGYATKAAHDAHAEIDKALRYFSRFNGNANRQSIDADYRDQIDALLERFDLRKGVSLRAIDKRKSLAEWIKSQEEQGLVPIIPDELVADTKTTHYKDMTVEEFRGLVDAVRNIEHLGRLKKKLLTAKDKREFDAIVDEAKDVIRNNAVGRAPARLESNTKLDKASIWLRGFIASHRKLASLMRQMAGFKDDNILWNIFVRPMNEAADREATMMAKSTKELHELFEPILKAGGLKRKTFIPEIGASLSREGRLMIALNWGNEANRQRIMDGDGWSEDQVHVIIGDLTADEWAFVQGVWDHIDSYWSDIAAKEKRLTGVVPEKVEAVPFSVQTKTGVVQLRGGYFPLKYDPNRSAKADAHAALDLMKQAQMGMVSRATTRRGHTKERLDKVERAVRKDFGVVFQHVSQVIHDLSWHEYLIDASRLLATQRIDSAIADHYGREVNRTLRDILSSVAAGSVPAQNGLEAAINHVRTGATMAGLGWNMTTALLQPFGLINSMRVIGPRYVMSGVGQVAGDALRMQNAVTAVHEKSPMMKLRHQTFQREVAEISHKIDTAKPELLQRIEGSFFWFIGQAQMVADIPTWLGAYEKYSALHPDDDSKAIALADQVVLDTQGGGAVKDLSHIQQGGPLQKLFTNFYSYMNVIHNNLAEDVAELRLKGIAHTPEFAADVLLALVIPTMLSTALHAAIHALTGGGDDDEDKWAKLVATLIKDEIGSLLGTMVGLRELGSMIQSDGRPAPIAGLRLLSEGQNLYAQIAQGKADEALFKSVVNTGGVLFHYPAGQINRTVLGIRALADGKTKNPLAVVTGPPTKH